MAAPITWQNVAGPSSEEASRGIQYAQQSFNNAFDKFGSILKDQSAVDDANWANQKGNNTQDFLDAVAQYRTPEALAAAQQSGELDRMRQGFGYQVDRAAIRSAQENQMGVLQTRDRANIDYRNFKTDDAEAPARDAFMTAVANNDKVAQDRIRAANLDMRNFAPLAKAGAQSARDAVTDVYADNRARYETNTDTRALETQRLAGLRQDSDLLTAKAQRGLIGAQTNAANATAAEKGDGKVADGLTSKMLQAFGQNQANYGQNVLNIGKRNGIASDGKGGWVIPDNIPTATLEAFKAQITALGPVPNQSEALAVLQKTMVGAGLPSKQVISALESANSLLGDGSNVTARTALSIKGIKEKQDKLQEVATKNNLFYTPKGEEVGAKKAVMDGVGINKDTFFFGTGNPKDEIASWMDGEFPFKKANGKVEMMAVPPKLLAYALSITGVEDGTYFRNSTARNAKEKVQELLSSPQFTEMRSQADRLYADPNGAGATATAIQKLMGDSGITQSADAPVRQLDAVLAARTAALTKTAGAEAGTSLETAALRKGVSSWGSPQATPEKKTLK